MILFPYLSVILCLYSFGEINVGGIVSYESWETGSPSSAARAARTSRYANARTQMTSAFPPQKRLTLERKSPVTRLDINAPGFAAYKKTYPGLFKE